MDTITPNEQHEGTSQPKHKGRKIAYILGAVVMGIAVILVALQTVVGTLSLDVGGALDPSTIPTIGTGYGSDGNYVREEAYGGARTTGISLPSPLPPIVGDSGPEFGEKIIKNGDLSLVVSDVDQAVVSIASIAKKHGGAILAQNINESQYRVKSKSGYVRIRVPHEEFEETFSELKDSADRVTSERVDTDDVTAQYVDLEARLKNHELRELRYREILVQARTIEDILRVQQNIDSTRFEIERIEAQLKNLSSQTDYSHITVSLSTDRITFGKSGWLLSNSFNKAVHGLLSGLTGFVDFFIAVVFALPVIILWSVLVLIAIFIVYRGGRWFIRRVKGAHKQEE